jgi:signal transduction protein with GAF and PtsI domain
MTDQAVLHEAIRDAANPMALLDRIVAQSLALVPHADGASLEVRRDPETLEYLCAAGTLADFVGLRLPLHQSLSGLAVLTGDVQVCEDGHNDPRVNAAAVARTGVVSMLCVPLSDREGGVAVLKVSARIPHAFDTDDIERLRLLAGFVDTTVSAASELARVTADVLRQLDAAGAPDAEEAADTARFVANVMTPGLVDQVDATSAILGILRDQALDVLFQPIVDLCTGEPRSNEAL